METQLVQPIAPMVQPVCMGQLVVSLLDVGANQPQAVNIAINSQFPTPPVNVIIDMLVLALGAVNGKMRQELERTKILHANFLPKLPPVNGNGKG